MERGKSRINKNIHETMTDFGSCALEIKFQFFFQLCNNVKPINLILKYRH